jgi:heme/copper-type cytochrome/quinol oxidase subunit 2
LQRTVFIMQTIQYIALYFIFRFWSGSTWYQNKEKEIIFVVVTYILYLIVGWFTWLLRPIIIEVKQTNSLGSGINQTLILQVDGETKTDQSLKTVKLELKVSRRGSIWWWLLMKLLSGKELCLEVEPVPDGMLLQANERFQTQELESTANGFKIDLTKLFNQLHNQVGKLSIEKTYLYSVTEHPDITIPSNLTSVVQPKLTLKSKPIKLLRLFIDFKTSQHEIKFFKK